MAEFGVTKQGFNKKSLNIIKQEIEKTLRDGLGKGINLLPEELFGQIVGIVAEREAEDWEREEALYFSQFPDTAEGVNLDNVSSITGSERRKSTPSLVQTQLLFGTVGTVISADNIISVSGNPLARFKTLLPVVLIAGTNEIQDISFNGDADAGGFKLNFNGQETIIIAFNDTAADVKSALEALSTVGTGNVSVTGSITQATGLTTTFLNSGPLGLGLRDVNLLLIVDNTLLEGVTVVAPTVAETTKGVPQGFVSLESEVNGVISGPSESLTIIETPVTGW
ncbi:MAG: hypothetical protein V3R67_07905, partial [Thermodesulfobacteriota bacterium]